MRFPAAPRRVVVTGLGVVSPAGIGLEAFWKGLQAPAPLRRERTVEDFDPSRWLSGKQARHLDRFTHLAVAAADLALDDCGGTPVADPARAGVQLGTGIGGLGTLETQVGVLAARGPGRVSPFTIPMVMPNAGAASVSLRHGLRGPSETLTTACAAGTHSVAAGARMVADGRCDVVLAGGAESSMTPTTVAAFTVMTALSRTGLSRPFDTGRDGFCIAEGAAVLVLEERGAALERGARIYGEILGAASTCDAHHMTAPSPDGSGAAACMRLALADADLDPGDIRAVNAHGTSTPLNDAAEAAAVAAVFGPGAVPVSSIKGVTGHGLGAAGALEAACVLLSFLHRELPPTMGTTEVDPALEIDVVLEPRAFEPGPTISNSFGFGGHNGSLILGPA
ncbi:MAG: beta-ketoacyl-[acyl-carrier-protein] synthase family protein [Actinomycetota bacterium]|nr:beta-ketoacyl-[acyl-carrier-protein] synthase family protein [Actinomycetota bacterium]